MKILGGLSLGAATLAILFGVLAGPAHAHEKWFVGEPAGGLRWDLIFRPLPLAIVGAVLTLQLDGNCGGLHGRETNPSAGRLGEDTKQPFYWPPLHPR